MWKKAVDIESLSLCSHYLRMVFEETGVIMATGTGFIYEIDNHYYLITNGHNITGVNPETNKRIANHAGFPTIIRTKARVMRKDSPNGFTSYLFDIDLYNDKEFKSPKWLIHPVHGYKVDVVAIPIEEKKNISEEIKLFPINNYNFDNEYSPDVSDDVFILGFPFNITGGKELPIWKKGNIATEVSIDIDNLPKILVDTATRSGMSGSPVIFKRSGFHEHPSKDSNKNLFGVIEGFVGIYSGRIGAEDNFKSQLGIVWKKKVIEEIFAEKKIGTIDFQINNE